MEINNGHLFPRLQPMITRHQSVVLIGFAVTITPRVKLAAAQTIQPTIIAVGRGSRCVLISFYRLRGVDGQPTGEQAHGQEAADAVD